MSAFQALLKLSQSQTAQSELAVQNQIASHQSQLEKKRREQEARERKEREMEAKMRLKRFEDERKEAERARKREEEELARARELARREEQMRDALKYGSRKASTSASGPSKARNAGDKDSGQDPSGGPALTREELRARQNNPDFLTREEKRERKLAAELRRVTASSSSRRGGSSKGTTSLPDGRTVRRLPGGAIDYTTVSRLVDPDAGSTISVTGKSARERLAAIPSTLTKLNTVKRDTRTIDEILTDRAKAREAKTLAGDEAKEFSDWFGKKKKDPPQPKPSNGVSAASSRAVSATPRSQSPAIPPSAATSASRSKPSSSKSSSSFLKPINPKASSQPGLSRTLSSNGPKKRPRSPSSSPTPPPPKRRSVPASNAPSRTSSLDIGATIWSIFGKDKKSYTARDVISDDEDDLDMEADAASVFKEEMRSARLAQKEDEIALEEEKRHEIEKRKRKKERERKEKA